MVCQSRNVSRFVYNTSGRRDLYEKNVLRAVEQCKAARGTHNISSVRLEKNDTYVDVMSCRVMPCEDFESAEVEGWQSFALAGLVDADTYVTEITIVMRGTGSGVPGFKLSNARVMGTPIDNPSDTSYVSNLFRGGVFFVVEKDAVRYVGGYTNRRVLRDRRRQRRNACMAAGCFCESCV